VPEVAAQRTPASPDDLRDLLIAGHISATGDPPSYNRLGVAWSQVMLEIGRGEAIWNHNVGNIKCPPRCQQSPANLYTAIPVTGSEYPIQRAYVGPVEGCAGYWRLIMGERYAPALPLFDAGKPYEAMMRMGELGYFEAPPEAYARAVSALFTEYVAKWPKHLHDPGGEPPPQGWGERNEGLIVGLAVVLGIATVAYVYTR
jgi:hypothetical protein